MKKILILICGLSLVMGCSDGEIIVTNFNFENAELKTCGDIGNYVFYKENIQVFESLSLKLGTTDSIYKTEGTSIYQLNGSNTFVNYRTYDGALNSNYFCSSVPPSSPQVISDFVAVSGWVEITVTFIYENTLPRETPTSHVINGKLNLNGNSDPSGRRATLKKNVRLVLKDIVLTNGDQQIIEETIDMGTIENVRTEEVTP